LNPLILLYSLGFLAALLAGIPGLIKVYSAIIKEKEVNLLFIAAAGILESVIILILLVLWEPIPFFRIFTFSVGGGRLALYLLLPLMLLSALFLESLAGRYGKKGQIPAAALIILLLPNFLWAATSEGFPLSEIALTGEFSQQATEPLKDLDTVFTWLEKNSDPSEGRILYQDTAYNINHPDLRWSHLMARGYERTGLWALGTVGQLFFPTDPLTRTQGFSIFGKLRHEISPDELEENMRLFNCRWALTCEPELEALFGSCRGMERVLSQGEFALFQAREPGSWVDIREGEGRVKTLLLQHHRRRFQAEISSPEGAVLLVKSSYHPWWNVELSGNRINPERGVPDQLLRIRVPEPGTYDIELEFRPARGLALLVTALGIIAAVILLLMERKKSMHGSRLDPLGKSHN